MQKHWQVSGERRRRMMFYKIIPSEKTKDKLFIPDILLKERVLIDMHSTVISAGHRTESIEICRDSTLNEDELIISKNVLESLLIPTDLKYQVKFEEGRIRIGPIIGLLMARSNDDLTRGRFRKLLKYCSIYQEIQGLILAVSEDSFDFDKKTVKGYYYNPEAGRSSAEWQPGIFPLPDSIFQRITLSENVRLRLKDETGNRLFNSNYFNKWQFWKMISRFKDVCEHLPNTSLLSSIDDIDYMLSLHDSAYLKPLSGTLSRGLYKVTKKDDTYGFQGKQGEEIIQISGRKAAAKHLEEMINGHRYLVQQAINPLRVDGRHLDFRVIMQKDNTLMWKCTGIVAFVGNRGDICTNWGYTTGFEDILAGHFNFSQREIFKIKQKIVRACKSVCNVLDLTGENYGDFGFDVLLDKSLKVWVLEANKRHYHIVPLWNNDLQTFYEVKANPVKYAVALSNFNVY
jgi:hypothetical protein